jgi:ATPase family associated with various cellular activities (AAA)
LLTGKTTVARTIANVLFSLGLMPSDKIKETSALDLTAGYVGQTKNKVNAALQEAKGGVLFIDEAYNLGKGYFGQEACDTIVAAMTSETFRDVVIVIAGYPDEINEMLKSNAGLKSRFNHFFEFPDWDSTDCVSFLQMLADREKFEMEDLAFDDFEAGCEELRRLDGWGNGRDVTKLWEMSKSNRGERAFDTGETRRIISMEDIAGAMNEMLAARRPRNSSKAMRACDDTDDDPDSPMATDFGSPKPPALNSRTATNRATENQPHQQEHIEENHSIISELESEEGSVTEDLDDDNSERDDGVPDDVWEDLVDAKRKLKEEQESLARQEEIHRQFMIEQDRREEEARRLHEERLEQIRREAELQEQQRLIQAAIDAEQERQRQAEMERRRRELALERLREKERKRLETIRRLQIIGRCPMGFEWYKAGCGWQCGGGSHYVSDEELRSRFGAHA